MAAMKGKPAGAKANPKKMAVKGVVAKPSLRDMNKAKTGMTPRVPIRPYGV